VQGSAHSPGPDDISPTDGIINVLVRQPIRPSTHSQPIGPHVLPLKRDNPLNSVDDSAGSITPDPVGIRTRGPDIHTQGT
jgi:hypothetical protein